MELLAGLAVAAVVGGMWWWSHRRHCETWEHFREVLGELGQGRQPEHLIFHEAAAPLTPALDEIANQIARLRQQISREESNLQAILASMDDGLMVVDAQHVLRMVNPSFLRIFDLKNDPRGLTVLQVLRDSEFEQTVTATLKTGTSQTREISTSTTKPSRHLSMHAAVIRDGSVDFAALAVVRDITRLKQLEEVRREFVANVSHELRTPLSIFHGYVETLVDHPDLAREDQAPIFDVLKKHSHRLNALLEDLLTLARLESRPEDLELEAVDLRALICTVSSEWKKKAAAKQIEICVEVCETLPPLTTEPLRLEQVLHNLLENAVKYTEEGGRVRLCAEQVGEQIELRVEDTGIGILPGDLPHIFERFYRADKARTRGGTGLGLSIVKHIVHAHGGTVSAKSTYGKGTVIHLRFPLTRAEPAQDVSQATPRNSP